MSLIETKNLTKRYGQRIGIVGLNLNVEAGIVYGFLGPNGSGKTTTIRLFLGLLKATSGEITIFGLDCWRNSQQIKADIGYLPGDLRLYPWLTCRSALTIISKIRGMNLKDIGLQMAEEFDLEQDVSVDHMSRGMRQKLGLILALAHKPKLLILDEPTAALDPLMQDKLFQHLRRFTAEGKTVFLSSHTLSEVERLCDRVAILRNGRMVVDKTIDELRDQAKQLIHITWKTEIQSSSITPPDCLKILERSTSQWKAQLNGDVMELIQWSSHQPIEKLSIDQPDLGTIFRRYYADAESGT